jgi:hypothetical protein
MCWGVRPPTAGTSFDGGSAPLRRELRSMGGPPPYGGNFVRWGVRPPTAGTSFDGLGGAHTPHKRHPAPAVRLDRR